MTRYHEALRQQPAKITTATFASDIKRGFSSKPKNIPSKYFYDAKGDFLFQQIMKMDEYYLTSCETEILESSKESLLEHFDNGNKPFDLVELGAGDGAKTTVIIDHFLKSKVLFTYIPIDISPNVMGILSADLVKKFPQLHFKGICGDYLECMGSIKRMGHNRKAVLFLGSNIGNFNHSDAAIFLESIRNNLSSGDFLLIGFDLKKDPEIILKAYNDSHGITSEFNMNLLERVNRELGGNFDISQFRHFPLYDPIKGEARSHLISLKSQKVFVEALQEEFFFDLWEPVFTEVSNKYTLSQIEAMAETSGFRCVDHYMDSRRYFVDSLWVVN
jgi:L-histidine Nalpha-methyltransferase